MDKPLVDENDFPLDHLDIRGIREARNKVICMF